MKWLDRSLILGPYYCLCLSEKEFKKALGRLKYTEPLNWIKNDYSHATLHTFTKESDLTCILCVRDEPRDIEVIHGLLAHEATHIFQHFKEFIGEDSPSDEFEAYSIQSLCVSLFYAYKKQSKVKRNVTTKNHK